MLKAKTKIKEKKNYIKIKSNMENKIICIIDLKKYWCFLNKENIVNKLKKSNKKNKC